MPSDLLTTPASDDVLAAELTGEMTRESPEHKVACAVAVLVVDALEVVEVEEREREGLPVLLGQVAQALELRLHPAPVGEPGQRVGVGELAEETHALQPVANASPELGPAERLGQVVVGAGCEHVLDSRRVGVRSEEEHGQPRPARVSTHDAAQLGPVHVRHVQIEYDEIRPGLLQRVPEAARVGECRDLVAVDGQQFGDRVQDRLVVVDGEDPELVAPATLGQGFGRVDQRQP